MVCSEAVERFTQASANGRNLGELCRRQVVQILVHRVAGVDLVTDAVEARHQQCRIAQIGVGEGIGETEFNALCLVAGAVRNAARSRTVAA